MTILLRDDAGTLHPVLVNVSAAEIPAVIATAEETKAAIAERYGTQPPPIRCD